MIKSLLATVVICFLSGAIGVAAQPLSAASAEIAAEHKITRAALITVSEDIASQRHKLQQQLQAIKVKTSQTKKTATQLKSSLQKLQQQEIELKKVLNGKQAVLNKIAAAVRDNANLVLANGNGYADVATAPEWYRKLEQVGASDKFPALEDIHFLNQTLLDAISASGQLRLNRETIFARSGEAIDALVLRCGNFQTFYQYGSEVGFLRSDPAMNGLQIAAYVADAAETEMIRTAFERVGKTSTGAELNLDRVPLDVSAGKLINDQPVPSGFFAMIKAGGWFIWPIVLIAIIGILLVIERSLVLYGFAANGREAVARGTELLTAKLRTPAEYVVRAMAQPDNDSLEVRESRMEEAILEQLPRLERFLQTLKIMAAISPLLGLLGTVSGIIQTFRVISTFGNGDPKLLSAGISEALLTTEAGLLVAIPLLLCHHFLQLRVKTLVLDMESAGAAMLSISTQNDVRP